MEWNQLAHPVTEREKREMNRKERGNEEKRRGEGKKRREEETKRIWDMGCAYIAFKIEIVPPCLVILLTHNLPIEREEEETSNEKRRE